jgi:hypothetical protein
VVNDIGSTKRAIKLATKEEYRLIMYRIDDEVPIDGLPDAIRATGPGVLFRYGIKDSG